MPLLYDAVAMGMGAYTRTTLRVRTLGVEGFRLEPGTILVATHRRETDVPLVCPSLYRYGRLWADRRHRITFAARDDLFEPGFFAGFPAGLPPRVRRALYGVGVGRYLRNLGVYPLRSATTVRLEHVFRTEPSAELDAVVPPATAAAFRARAAEVGLPEPRYAGDVLRGEYADLLWLTSTRAELGGPALESVWSRRAADATADFRLFVELLRRGAVLLVFPEGRPSPDGSIGPLRPGLGALVRRSRPARLLPVGLAYDPLGRGRTRAYVSFGKPVPTPEEGIEEVTLALLRRAMPLTCGQVVARLLLSGESSAGELERRLEEEVEAACAEGRNVEPDLLDRGSRRRRLEEALAAAESRSTALELLAREYASAREA